jgi:uncharacterized membrane protein
MPAAKRKVWLCYLCLLGLSLAWLGLILAAPLLMANSRETAALVIYRAFANLCHQRAERSYHWAGWPLAVCARCLGIYGGFLLGALFYPCLRRIETTTLPQRRWLLLALAIITLDWSAGSFGWGANSFFTRTAAGGIVGVVAAFYLLPLVLRWPSSERNGLNDGI